MLKAVLAVGFSGLMGLPVAADVTKDDLKKLTTAGVSEQVILAYIKTNGPVVKLSADDLVELKDAGLTAKVLTVAAAGGSPDPVPARTPVGGLDPDVYVPSTTYVYSTPPSYWYSYGIRPFSYYSQYGVYSPHYSYQGHYPAFSHHAPYRAHHGAFHHGGSHHRAGHHGGGHHR